jgi:hypothetical protein
VTGRAIAQQLHSKLLLGDAIGAETGIG